MKAVNKLETKRHQERNAEQNERKIRCRMHVHQVADKVNGRIHDAHRQCRTKDNSPKFARPFCHLGVHGMWDGDRIDDFFSDYAAGGGHPFLL